MLRVYRIFIATTSSAAKDLQTSQRGYVSASVRTHYMYCTWQSHPNHLICIRKQYFCFEIIRNEEFNDSSPNPFDWIHAGKFREQQRRTNYLALWKYVWNNNMAPPLAPACMRTCLYVSIITWALRRLKSPTTWLFVGWLVQASNKNKIKWKLLISGVRRTIRWPVDSLHEQTAIRKSENKIG